jgi:mono/diheme cytochrome c family protein
MWFHSRGNDVKKTRTILFSFVVIAVALSLPGVALPQTAPAGSADNGKRLFNRNNCYYCHGTVGQGGRDGARIGATVLSSDAFMRYVRRPAGAMPAYTDKILSDKDLADILAYLKSIPAAKAPKDIPLLDQMRDKP